MMIILMRLNSILWRRRKKRWRTKNSVFGLFSPELILSFKKLFSLYYCDLFILGRKYSAKLFGPYFSHFKPLNFFLAAIWLKNIISSKRLHKTQASFESTYRSEFFCLSKMWKIRLLFLELLPLRFNCARWG